MPSHIYLAQFATAVTVIPKEGDHRLSTEVTSLDGAPSLLAFMLLWGVSRRFLTHRSHLVLRTHSGLATSAADHSEMSRTMGIFHFCNLDVPQQIAANFSERLLTIAANFFRDGGCLNHSQTYPASRPRHYVLWEGYLCTQTQDLTSPDGCSIKHRESNPGPLL